MTDVGGLGLASHRLLENKVPPNETPRIKADQRQQCFLQPAADLENPTKYVYTISFVHSHHWRKNTDLIMTKTDFHININNVTYNGAILKD